MLQTFLEAGRKNKGDPMSSASSRLAMGMVPESGTHAFDIISEARQPFKRRSEVANFLDAPIHKRSRFTLPACAR